MTPEDINDGLHCNVCKKQFPNADLVIVKNKFVCITCMGFHD